ncbi:hypothetical protein ACJ72_03404 [Emergomyces africanus]|uniref:Uncharacterized protein n=1 Tax=Emergomyces africanus TaxID=1955775 RepID=A0A1B7NZN8_9EURO|nr:hypothetical protein ACJ72_03404 [Emergomyces africanus]
MLRQRIKSIGIGLTDRVPGPYDLRIHRIWATNGLSEEEMDEERRICGANALQMTGKEWGPGGLGRPSMAEQEGEVLEKLKGLKEEKEEGEGEGEKKKRKDEDEW